MGPTALPPLSHEGASNDTQLTQDDNTQRPLSRQHINYGSLDNERAMSIPAQQQQGSTASSPVTERQHSSARNNVSARSLEDGDNDSTGSDNEEDRDNNSQAVPGLPNNTDNGQDKSSARRRVTIRRHPSQNSNNANDDQRSFDSLEREMTLKDRQEAMNKRHPFGLPIWKPALYKKSRSVVRRANSALHSSPSSSPELFLHPGNILWLILFGWWLSSVIFLISLVMMIFPPNGRSYGLVMRELAFYLLWPFGRYVERTIDIFPSSLETGHSGTSDNFSVAVDDEDQVTTMDEQAGLLGGHPQKRNGQASPQWYTSLVDGFKLGPAAWIYYLLFFTVIAPLLMLVSTICWFCVITIPMAKLNYLLVRYLRRHPLSLRFKSSPSGHSQLTATGGKPTVILLCTYQAVGWQYYKYTYDGINIIFINLIPLIFFVILDEFVLKRYIPDSFICAPSFVFALSLASVIPLSYFIGMGVSSVSAQSSMGVAAAINATFGSIIEIILYSVALTNGKSRLVEGSLIGSFLAGVLLMPGMSMLSSSVKRKEQRFNAKSAGVTSTMLIMAIIGALTPTIFYQMFGSFELKCVGCPDGSTNGTISCSRCYYDQLNPTIDPVYQNSVKPLMWLCAAILPSVYFIGLIFSLHTHVEMIWDSGKSHSNQHQESYYQKLLPSHIISQLVHSSKQQHPRQLRQEDPRQNGRLNNEDNAIIPTNPIVTVTYPSYDNDNSNSTIKSTSLPSSRPSLPTSTSAPSPISSMAGPSPPTVSAFIHAKEPDEEEEEDEEMAGHDSPNWGKAKSYTILCACTILYAIIAEILVDTVDLVMENLAVDEKFLGLTLFALVPNITEFMNAISFALYGNIVLRQVGEKTKRGIVDLGANGCALSCSMEIGSSYSLQVCLLQIPSMVAFSYWLNYGKEELAQYTFSLVFPRWDVITVIFSVFLLTYTYQEGKANYFKGSILILSYFVLILAFYFIPPFSETGVLIGAPSVN